METDSPAEQPPARSWWPSQRWPRTTVVIEIVLVGLVGAWLGLLVGGRLDTSIGPLEARLSIEVAPTGGSVLSLPPLGELSLHSHDGPFRLHADVTQINEADAREIFNDPKSLQGLPQQVSADLTSGVRELVIRSAVSAVAGAVLLGIAVFRRRFRRALLSGAVAFGAVAAGGGLAAVTWNPEAINEPRYTGLLASAPSVVGDAGDIVTDFKKYEKQLAKIVTNVSRLYDVTSTLPAFAPTASTIHVLFVSDLHINPGSWDVIRSIVKQFDIDFIVDTGDISDHGSSAENAYVQPIGTLGVPYVFVRGNHDSLITEQAIRDQPNAVVLDNQIREVGGLRLAGMGDPRFTPDKNTRDAPAPVSVKEKGVTLANLIKIQPANARVDVAMMHDPEGAAEVDGAVPLTLAGHYHRRFQQELPNKTLLFVQGSTGASGLRGLEGEKPTSAEASVLYFDRTTRALQAWDDITLGGLGLTSVKMERHLRSSIGGPKELSTPSPTGSTPSPSDTASGSQSPSALGPAAPAGRRWPTALVNARALPYAVPVPDG
jgi:predicted MPP superfamily phosphohydrolase